MVEKKQISFPRYEHYKEINIDWITTIPEEWEVKRIKMLYKIGRGRVISQEELEDNGLYPVYSSQTKNKGILGYINTYDYAHELITWTTDGVNAGTVFLRKGKFNCTNVCGTLEPKDKTSNLSFIEKVLSIATLYYKRPDTNGAKIMNDEMANVYVVFPPLPEQIAIAQFLDHKTAQIDRAIAIKEAQIKLLNERKQIMIQEAVTKGLDPSVPMKDSGIEWIGEIPAHWEIKRLGSFFSERREIVSDIDYPPLSVTMKGIVPQLDTAAKSQDSNNRKLVCVGDFVINSRSDRKGSSGVSPLQGSVSLINTVLSPNGIYSSYTNYLLKSYIFIEEYYRIGRGIVADLWTTRYSEMKNIMIAIPSLAEQTAIAQFLDHKTAQLDRGVEKIKSQVQTLKEYKTTLINEAVTGKIKVY